MSSACLMNRKEVRMTGAKSVLKKRMTSVVFREKSNGIM